MTDEEKKHASAELTALKAQVYDLSELLQQVQGQLKEAHQQIAKKKKELEA